MAQLIGDALWIGGFVLLAAATIYNGVCMHIMTKSFQDLRQELKSQRENSDAAP